MLNACAGLSLALMAGCAASPPQHEEVEAIVHDYLMNHPEVIAQSMVALLQRGEDNKRKEQAAAIDSHQEQLTRDANSPAAGNPDGDVTIVEFFDYHCGHCRAAQPALAQLLKDDPKLRLVYKQFPVLGPDSALAARASLAAARQGKHSEMHEALMAAQSLDEMSIDAIATHLNLDMARFRADRDSDATAAQLQADYALATDLNINGTPSFVIGHSLSSGAGDIDALKAMVSANRPLAATDSSTKTQ